MRIGTRRSALALAQAELVAGMIAGEERPEIVPIVTGGDAGAAVADKSRWVAELEQALLEERIDLAVHSAKDVPGDLAEGTIAARRATPAPRRRTCCAAAGAARSAGPRRARGHQQPAPPRADCGPRARTSRWCRCGATSTRAWRSSPTRVERLDAIVLARAGLVRLGREKDAGGTLDPARFVPAPGQGALALQGRADDERALQAAGSVNDEGSMVCLRAERALAAELEADCNTPLGAHAALTDEGLRLRAWVGLPDGSAWATDEMAGAPDDPESLGQDGGRPSARDRRGRAAGERAGGGGRWPLRATSRRRARSRGASTSSAGGRAIPGC